ncbi:serine/threonine-protein phosphatase 6 regulatory ankyrin repeat subunit A-like isoform X3 [Crassostrea angulata]|nr:serine/threonine-protein phosphatase 6 regulatory ankyrin repeat subunit A-like isoform X3 [Crassostrea angulata]XP_052703311.1 serine/threonine-protein phosphatase 6 regulatory ankyrin repeat subunit A-like isoform X3 [Crassostrea angulata]XP_052703312.1 serine/threonine-protein phosphatase 6 regulatory ankyrin repeat subunit A-like isoform X3 [Crassostrea angulata]
MLVYPTKACPTNEEEWNDRSTAIKCTTNRTYMCLPNKNFTELLEFCNTYPQFLISKDICLYLDQSNKKLEAYACHSFESGCPNSPYSTSKIFQYQSCLHIENGCFSAEQTCERHIHTKNVPINDNKNLLLVGPIFGLIVPFLVLSMILYYFKMRRKPAIAKKQIFDEERAQLMKKNTPNDRPAIMEDTPFTKAIFNQWEQDDSCFISTQACKEVEKMIESRNLVIVAGHSGSGKSAIIQHIALKYREQGWTLRRVMEVKDIVNELYSSRFQKNKTMCVFNDPLGKESFDEILNSSWQKYEEELKVYLKNAKLLMSCRNHIIFDVRLRRFVVNQSPTIINIDDNKNKLSIDEKRQILTKYTSGMNLSERDCDEIVKVEQYFPLLCKLCSCKKDYKKNVIEFFTEPLTVLKEEILGFRTNDKYKYCALALLVLFNDDLCIKDILETKHTEHKFKHTLKLCGLPVNTQPSVIRNNLNSLMGVFVKATGDKYNFSHDFVMEVTTFVFGNDYPSEIVKYADIDFLRRKVKLGNCDKHDYSFTIYLSDRYIEELGERLFSELFGKHLLDVILNPSLRNKKIIKVLKKKITDHPANLQMLLETKKLALDKQEIDWNSNNLLMSKFHFLNLENEVSPLFALIVFCHTQLSQYGVITLQQQKIDSTRWHLIPAMCCNGSVALFNSVFKDIAEKFFKKTWGVLCPIHIVSGFHNYQLLNELINVGVDVNQKTDDYGGWTPLLFAAGNDTQEYGDYDHTESGAERKYETIQLLLNHGADINLCMKDGTSPLFVACENGDNSIVQLLLRNRAAINLCQINGTSPLYIACQNGHESTVQLLLRYGADINLCQIDQASPLYTACQNGHDNTVQLLLSNGADTNLYKWDGTSPLCTACENGHESTVQLLLSNGADINICMDDGTSPLYIACQKGHDSTVQFLLSNGADINLCKKNGSSPLYIACQNGHDSTVQLLLSNGADINLSMKDKTSPLYTACYVGNESTVQLLLSNGADINLCKKNGTSPLYIACQNGHDSTVQLLLSNKADVNLCKENGTTPFHTACQNGHDSTVQLLLSNGADINLCDEDGASPLYKACENGHDSTVQLLLCNGADINLCDKNGTSPLYLACQNGYVCTVQLLLSNGADINLCDKNGISPLSMACFNGHDSIVLLLLGNGADINSWNEKGASPFCIACENGHDSTVQHLMRYGADINLCMEDGASPLYTACQNRHLRTVQLLLNQGADINLCKKNGDSPLNIACKNGHEFIVQLLLRKGADINLCMEDGTSPLYTACQNRHLRTVQLLLNQGADINLCKKNGDSPLYIACKNGHEFIVQLLLRKGADINLCMEDGTSPLYTACQNGHDSIVHFLLWNGANINLCLQDGTSPLSVACQNGQNSTVQLLLRYGADIN